MPTIEEMQVSKVIRNYTDWETIIRNVDPHIANLTGAVIIKNSSLPHPEDYFNEIVPSSLSSFPERQGNELSFKSWRIRDYPGKGYHIHEFEEFYLLHKDVFDPKDPISGALHLLYDTSPSEKIMLGAGAYLLLSLFKKK